MLVSAPLPKGSVCLAELLKVDVKAEGWLKTVVESNRIDAVWTFFLWVIYNPTDACICHAGLLCVHIYTMPAAMKQLIHFSLFALTETFFFLISTLRANFSWFKDIHYYSFTPTTSNQVHLKCLWLHFVLFVALIRVSFDFTHNLKVGVSTFTWCQCRRLQRFASHIFWSQYNLTANYCSKWGGKSS